MQDTSRRGSKTRVDEEGNFRNEEGNTGNQLFISDRPWHLKRHNEWMGDTWHVSRLGESMWFPTNKTMTRGTNSLANVQKKSHFSRRPMDKGAIDDTGKSTNSRLVHNGSSWSMTAARESQDEEISSMSKTGRTRLQIISSWADCTINTTVLTWALHPHSEIDKIDVNRCQRRLD